MVLKNLQKKKQKCLLSHERNYYNKSKYVFTTYVQNFWKSIFKMTAKFLKNLELQKQAQHKKWKCVLGNGTSVITSNSHCTWLADLKRGFRLQRHSLVVSLPDEIIRETEAVKQLRPHHAFNFRNEVEFTSTLLLLIFRETNKD